MNDEYLVGMTEDGWPEKAYKSIPFLTGPDARSVRVLCEFTEPQCRFDACEVEHTVVFFGSARLLPLDTAEKKYSEAEAEFRKAETSASELALSRAKHDLAMSHYYEDAALLSEKLTLWSLGLPGPLQRFMVCSGGGPGIMEAANRGASRAGGRSIGLNVSLPFEQIPNPYQTRELSFDFHYFFIRKFWFVHLARALVVFPGGFGTFDEMFELLTLVQTKKTSKKRTIVVYGSEYWKEVINFDAIAKWGMIEPDDLKLFRFIDDVDEAFEYLTSELTKNYLENGD
jgi:uncharacterized protein (TIGR00730 family)